MKTKKERRFQTPPSTYSTGRVHRYLWSYTNKLWYVACAGPAKVYHGRQVDQKAVVTCRKCLR